MSVFKTYAIKETVITDIVTKLYYGVNNDLSQEAWKQLAYYLLGELRAEGFSIADNPKETK